MSPEQLADIAKRLAVAPASRPVGGVEYVPASQYQDILSIAQELYAAATEPKAAE